MPVGKANINVLQENLEKLEQFNMVMKNMATLKRVPVSMACRSLVAYMKASKDPLLFVAHALNNSAYLRREQKKKKGCLCF